MEFIDGSPLRGPLRVEEVVRRGIQIAAALEEANAKNILHSDLKSEPSEEASFLDRSCNTSNRSLALNRHR
jgi:hypothetical protein